MCLTFPVTSAFNSRTFDFPLPGGGRDNGENYMKYDLQTFADYLYVVSKAMIQNLGVVFETHCIFFSR